MRKVGEPLRSRVDDHRHDVDAGTANRSLCASPQDVQQASTAPPRIHVVGRVVIAGSGHVMYNQGINLRLARRKAGEGITVVMTESTEPIAAANGLGDFLYVSPAPRT